MENNTIDLGHDVEEIDGVVQMATVSLEELKTAILQAATEMTKTFTAVVACLGNMGAEINGIGNTLSVASATLQDICSLAKSELAAPAWYESVYNAFKEVLTFISLLDSAQKATESWSATIQMYVAAVRTMVPEVGHFAAVFPKLSMALKSVCTWAGNAAKAVGESFVSIGGSVAEGIKSLGSLIAQLAVSTAEWVKNTAAKVASTAAEWAQIAATTAWNALCAVATAVTTAFGAAMAFLTSPIGLVVVATGITQ